MRKKHPIAGLLSCQTNDATISTQVSWRLLSPEPETGACALSFGSAEWLSCRGLRAFRAPKRKEYRIMRGIKKLGLALVAVCAFSAIAVSSASASRFLAHPPGELEGKALGNQVFSTAAGNVICEGLKLLSSSAASLESETQEVTVDYSTCKAFGKAATVTPVLYLFNANGWVDLLGTVKVKATLCTVTVFPATSLKTVKYKNFGQSISVEGEVAGITSEGTETACKYAKESKGTYTGVADVSLVSGGLLKWDA